jgi:ribosome-associated protein
VPLEVFEAREAFEAFEVLEAFEALEARRGLTEVDVRASSEQLARRIAETALDKKARDIVVLDMRGVVSYTDFFVICTGNTERQTKAIEDAIYQDLKHSDSEQILPGRVEGRPEARWILMDYLDCVVHIFTPSARDYYRLEMLWGEVPALEVG